MKKLLLPLMLGVAFIFNSALIAAPCVQWNQVKSDIEKYFAEKKNLQMLSLEKAGDAEYNTFTSKTGKYITDKDGNTIELEKKEEKCVQIAKVVFVDESKTKMTETWSVIYVKKNGKLVYDGFIPKTEVTEISEARLLPSDDELKKLIIPAWNKEISGDDIELVAIKELTVKSKYYTHTKQASKWIVNVDMTVVRKGGLLSGNKECKVSGTMLTLVKKQELDPWKLEFNTKVFRCDRN